MRAYIWREMRDWLKEGGAIPKDPVLHTELVGIQTVPRMEGLIQLEAKKDMKKRVGFSPNRADALAISFAYPVTRKARGLSARRPNAPQREHDPYASLNRVLDANPVEHNPYDLR
jgi:hypothetical protein